MNISYLLFVACWQGFPSGLVGEVLCQVVSRSRRKVSATCFNVMWRKELRGNTRHKSTIDGHIGIMLMQLGHQTTS